MRWRGRMAIPPRGAEILTGILSSGGFDDNAFLTEA